MSQQLPVCSLHQNANLREQKIHPFRVRASMVLASAQHTVGN